MNACTKCKTKFNGSKCSKCKSSSNVRTNVSSYEYNLFTTISDTSSYEYGGGSSYSDGGSSSSDGGSSSCSSD